METNNLPEFAMICDENLPTQLGAVPGGYLPLVISQILAQLKGKSGLVFVASGGQQLDELLAGLSFFAPEQRVLELPAWDCLPYDRVSPSNEVTAQRIATLGRIGTTFKLRSNANAFIGFNHCQCIGSTPSSIEMRWRKYHSILSPGKSIAMESVAQWLASNGYERNSTVHDRGEFAVSWWYSRLFCTG